MRTLLALLAAVALPLHASTIWFDPPNPKSNTDVIAHMRVGTCPINSTSVAIHDRIIPITIVERVCTTPAPLDGYPVAVDLGVLPAGVYDVVVSEKNLLVGLAEGTLTVRDAAPAFTLTPDVAAASGQQTVTIHGLNLPQCPTGTCAHPTVTFGGVNANVIEFASPDHLVVDAPAHVPGTVDVTVSYGGVTYTAVAAFHYFAFDAPADRAFFEPVVFPTLVSGPGAFGSNWSTEVTLRNENDYTFPTLSLFDVVCMPVCDIRPPAHSTRVATGVNAPSGYLLNVPRQAAPNVFFNIVVRDLSRQADAFGTQIPVVRENDFYDRRFTLLNVPADSRYRVALRFYRADEGTTVHYRIYPLSGNGAVVDTVATLARVAPASSLMFGGVGDLLTLDPQLVGNGPLRIDVEGSTDIRATWAFVSVTNNATQNVTVIAPQ